MLSLLVEGVRERMKFEQAPDHRSDKLVQNLHLPESSRRRKGAKFFDLVVIRLMQSGFQGQHFYHPNMMNFHLESLSWSVSCVLCFSPLIVVVDFRQSHYSHFRS